MTSGSRESKTILIVDDNTAGRELSIAALRTLGYDLIPASSGIEALSVIRSRPVDLVLLDLRMPGLNGFDVVRELRQASDTAGLCVVALTACAMNGDRDSALDAGFDGFITKPVGVASLREQVMSYLEHQFRSAIGTGIEELCPSCLHRLL